MAQKNGILTAFYALTMAISLLIGPEARADDSVETREQLRQLQLQNHALQEQLQQQQKLIESLSQKVSDIQSAGALRASELEHLESEMKDSGPATKSYIATGLGKVNISGEGGMAFFNTGSQGFAPNAEFRVDEAKLFVDAPIWGEVYFFTELNLMTREADDLSLQLGECYLDFENVSKLWNRDRQLNLRVGRMDIPFGEEYLSRDAIDNPLISHSLSDLWGVDAGLELYGSAGKLSYVLAVQNGGIHGTRDFDSDKSLAGRVSFDANSWLHFSVSGMRTGDLDVNGDQLSALWFGNGWFRSLGSAATTKFHANLVEGDVAVRWPHGHVKAFGGYINYDDNDPAANNRREVYYYCVEAVQNLTPKLYAGARFSQMFAPNGFPIVGNGDMGTYLFGPLTEEIWRLSLGLGYRWSQNLLVKAEYALEQGKLVSGGTRNQEDLVAIEAAFKF